jgi:hypothetical protein
MRHFSELDEKALRNINEKLSAPRERFQRAAKRSAAAPSVLADPASDGIAGVRQNKIAGEMDISPAISIWWGKKDSNLRSHKTADLQSAPFATRDTPPRRHRTTSTETMVARPWMTLKTRAR